MIDHIFLLVRTLLQLHVTLGKALSPHCGPSSPTRDAPLPLSSYFPPFSLPCFQALQTTPKFLKQAGHCGPDFAPNTLPIDTHMALPLPSLTSASTSSHEGLPWPFFLQKYHTLFTLIPHILQYFFFTPVISFWLVYYKLFACLQSIFLFINVSSMRVGTSYVSFFTGSPE